MSCYPSSYSFSFPSLFPFSCTNILFFLVPESCVLLFEGYYTALEKKLLPSLALGFFSDGNEIFFIFLSILHFHRIFPFFLLTHSCWKHPLYLIKFLSLIHLLLILLLLLSLSFSFSFFFSLFFLGNTSTLISITVQISFTDFRAVHFSNFVNDQITKLVKDHDWSADLTGIAAFIPVVQAR